jgi:hypothetical protein
VELSNVKVEDELVRLAVTVLDLSVSLTISVPIE